MRVIPAFAIAVAVMASATACNGDLVPQIRAMHAVASAEPTTAAPKAGGISKWFAPKTPPPSTASVARAGALEVYLQNPCSLFGKKQLTELSRTVHTGRITYRVGRKHGCAVVDGHNDMGAVIAADKEPTDLTKEAADHGIEMREPINGFPSGQFVTPSDRGPGKCVLVVVLSPYVGASLEFRAKRGSAEFADPCAAARRIGTVITQPLVN